MHRPWQIWSGFIAALVIVVAGVGWLSFRAFESDRAEAEARRQAALEEDVRLALWRMDSQMAAFVAQESARNADAYQPFIVHRLPGATKPGGDKGATICSVPSPLLARPLPEVFVYFQCGADGTTTSPQVPIGPLREQAVPAVVTDAQIELYEQRLTRLSGLVNFDALVACLPVPEEPPADLAFQTNQEFNNNQGLPNNSGQGIPNNFGQSIPNNAGQIAQRGRGSYSELPEQQEQRQQALGLNEFRRRSNYVQQSTSNTVAQAANVNATNSLNNSVDEPDDSLPTTTMTPRVIGGELLLARTVSSRGKTWLQGCWIDWKMLREKLLAEITDLLPQADLKLVAQPLESEQSRMLAALPVRLDPGTISASAIIGFSPVRQSLVVAWGAMFLAALAVAVLLRGVVALSERRADFVSAVTHELRTPLTTFRMYAEMLSEGMVPDETARRKYLDTLRIEADRLTHLVENVLAYARLERGGLGNRIQPVSGDDLLKLAAGRLSERAREAGLSLSVSADDQTPQVTVLCDASAVEQILFNLVDNACKYARQAENKMLDIAARSTGGRLDLLVRDHGPGISAGHRRRLFQPFRKSADEAARSAPGVGLGLALSRRLARDMGGDLRFDETVTDGAAFVLTLPLV